MFFLKILDVVVHVLDYVREHVVLDVLAVQVVQDVVQDVLAVVEIHVE
jgi:hypothetical protein